jgi:predicted dehydrogenase
VIRIGIIGCGSVTQQYHLPAIAVCPAFRIAALADTNAELLSRVCAAWSVAAAATDYRDVRDVDAVLIATPHALHAPMCEHFLDRGVHVLVEKPMVIRSADAERLVALADERRAVFAVGVFRRYYPISTFMRDALRGGRMAGLGALRAIDAEEGAVYDWQLQSRFLLSRELAGGGVLIDTGSHLLDRLLWWLPEFDARIRAYRDDSAHGVEADCELLLDLARGDQVVSCAVRMSRIRELRNTIRLTFDDGVVEIGANAPDGLALRINGWPDEQRLRAADCAAAAPTDFFIRQMQDFARAIESGLHTANDAASNVHVVRLIEEAYARREPLAHDWEVFR